MIVALESRTIGQSLSAEQIVARDGGHAGTDQLHDRLQIGGLCVNRSQHIMVKLLGGQLYALIARRVHAGQLALKLAFCVGLVGVGTPAPANGGSPSGVVALEYISISQLLPAGQIKISGGYGAVPSEWRSIAIAKAGHMTCTASLVGRSVILTSAHCVDGSPYNDQTSVILGSVKFGDTVTPLTECKMHPDYAQARMAYPWPRHASDFALCTLKFPVSGMALETIATALLADQAPVTLLGFGCSNLKIKNNKIDPVYDPPDSPVLRIGAQKIADLNAPIAGVGNGFALTVSRQGSPNLCPGDSGGPVLTGIASLKAVKSRQIAAVASAMHGKWNLDGQDVEFYSFLAPVTTSVRAWIKSWGDARGLTICGIHRLPGTDECRA